MRVALVVPTIRQTQCSVFLDAWDSLLQKHAAKLFLVEDSWEKKTVMIKGDWEYSHLCRTDLPPELSSIYQTDAIRSLGILKAYKEGYELIISLDDDVVPIGDPINEYKLATQTGLPTSRFFDVGRCLEARDKHQFMRGFPYRYRRNRPCVLQAGGWDGNPDTCGIDQLNNGPTSERFIRQVFPIPYGCAVTVCSMNMAIHRTIVPAAFQLPMGANSPWDRWGDIWSGLIMKRICDHLDLAVAVNGKAVVRHDKASNAYANIEKESKGGGMEINERMWEMLSGIELIGESVKTCYEEIALYFLGTFDLQELGKGMERWAILTA